MPAPFSLFNRSRSSSLRLSSSASTWSRSARPMRWDVSSGDGSAPPSRDELRDVVLDTYKDFAGISQDNAARLLGPVKVEPR